jgi:hypothetical protein
MKSKPTPKELAAALCTARALELVEEASREENVERRAQLERLARAYWELGDEHPWPTMQSRA